MGLSFASKAKTIHGNQSKTQDSMPSVWCVYYRRYQIGWDMPHISRVIREEVSRSEQLGKYRSKDDSLALDIQQ